MKYRPKPSSSLPAYIITYIGTLEVKSRKSTSIVKTELQYIFRYYI